HHFSTLFSEHVHVRPNLSGINFKEPTEAENESLIRPFSEAEVKGVIWSCEGDKSPGPDEFKLHFL
ncbi:hypothetical protein A2U01_0059907, partial [Trifolium medium]|nr:hypothetical protein [Trifolium medium]